MSDLRYDPIFGQWACIAENRQTRPFEFQQITQRRAGIDCPFCKGNESVTPPAILEWPGVEPNSPNPEWLIRVLPNKYPAFDHSLTIQRFAGKHDVAAAIGTAYQNVTPEPLSDDELVMPGFQEVIVLSPRHVASLSGLSDEELFASFTIFQQRVLHHSSRSEINHVCLFMNCRPLAGASIEHAHFQLIASPVCTDQVKDRVERMNRPHEELPNQCNWQALLNWELHQKVRITQETDDFQVFCPFASRFSNQIRIAPKSTIPFSRMEQPQLQQLAKLCRRWISGIERCLDNPAYNLIFHLPPTAAASHGHSPDSTSPDDNAWFVDLVPRFPQAAGFELATDCWVNPVSPESAAEQYRRFAESNDNL